MAGLLLPAAFSFGPALLSHLFGGEDPQQRLRRQLMALLTPENLARLTNQNYSQFLGSPAYQSALGNIAAGANATQGLLAQRAGSGGFTNSGTGALMSSITPSIVGGQQGQLRLGGYQMAQNQANDQIYRQLQALTGTSGPSQSSQLFAGGLSAFGPYLQAYLSKQYPNLFNFGNQAQVYGQQPAQNPNLGAAQ